MNRFAAYALTFIILLFASQSSTAQRTGGPCGYKHINFPARVIMITGGADTTKMNVYFEVTHSEKYKDTTSYYSQFGRYARKSLLDEKGVITGATFNYVEMHITSGACTPFIKRLTLDKYLEQKE